MSLALVVCPLHDLGRSDGFRLLDQGCLLSSNWDAILHYDFVDKPARGYRLLRRSEENVDQKVLLQSSAVADVKQECGAAACRF